MALPMMALMAAPMVLQGIGSIFSFFKGRKAKKKMMAQNKVMQQQLEQMKRQTSMMATGGAMGIQNSFMMPSGLNAGNYGPMRPGMMPPMFA